eukprot:TRINITY_DN1684_c0_g1_i15.p2 TRINITY_DN1684_c0_g1~~TRINITY_DN1684_c0_g1_i15.p2  ORF type:complete len:167 (+),score=12.61 TRINITY_DN1684_c0_g1_i15:448-948(+)
MQQWGTSSPSPQQRFFENAKHGNYPLAVLLNKVDLCTPLEVFRLRNAILALDLPNCIGTPLCDVEVCTGCGGTDISLRRKKRAWRCASCECEGPLQIRGTGIEAIVQRTKQTLRLGASSERSTAAGPYAHDTATYCDEPVSAERQRGTACQRSHSPRWEFGTRRTR